MDLIDAYRIFAGIYDAYTTERTDIRFYCTLAREQGGPVLELACGTGRIALPLARAGLEVWALDCSQEMLARAQARAARARAEVRTRLHWVCGDMRSFNLGQRMSLVVLAYNSFLHLLDQDSQLRCLHAVRQHLRPGGVFAMDIVEPSYYLFHQAQLGKSVTTNYGVTQDENGYFSVYEEERADPATQRSHCIYRVYDCSRTGRCHRLRCTFTLEMRYVFAAELQLLLRLAGFDGIQLYGGFDRRPYEGDSGRIVAVATTHGTPQG